MAAQLPITVWPEPRVLIAAVDAETGERHAFERESGIDRVDAVIATTASFGASPMLFQATTTSMAASTRPTTPILLSATTVR